MIKRNLTVSIGVPAHNEEANIGNLLNNLLGQSLSQDAILKEILVVADGRDRTIEIVKNFQKANKVLKLIVEEATLTKKLNTMLESAQGEILVVTNADTVPKAGTISSLIEPFHDKTVGSVVGKTVPVNDPHSFWGYIHHLFYKWNYLPEFFRMDFEGSCSFRRDLIKHIPLDVLDYEPYMDAAIREKSIKLFTLQKP